MSSTWFHGIEHLTVDDEGFVRWKGQSVERFKPELAESDAAKGRAKILVRSPLRAPSLAQLGRDGRRILATMPEGAKRPASHGAAA
jgi:hypothetical protein